MGKNSSWVENINCSFCGSSDGNAVYLDKDTGKYNSTCMVCGNYNTNPYNNEDYKPKPKIKTDEDKVRETQDKLDYPYLKDCRGIKEETSKYFNFRMGVSGKDGVTPTMNFYPSYKEGLLTGWEVRILDPKRLFGIGGRSGTLDLGGWEQAKKIGNRKKLYLAEDALSGASIFQAYVDNQKGTKWENYLPAVVWFNKGVKAGVAEVGKLVDDIKKNYTNLVTVLDNDKPGQQAVKEISRLFDVGFVENVKLPLKDPNDMLQAGRGEELAKTVMFRAKAERNDGA